MVAGASLAVSYTLVDAETLLVWALDAKGGILHAERTSLSGIIGSSCKYPDVEQLVCVLLRNMELLTDGQLRGVQPPAASANGAADTAAALPTAAGARLAAATTAAVDAVSTAASAAAAAQCGSRKAGAVGSEHTATAEAAAAEAEEAAKMAWEAALNALQVLADILLRPIAGQLFSVPENATVRCSMLELKYPPLACWSGHK